MSEESERLARVEAVLGALASSVRESHQDAKREFEQLRRDQGAAWDAVNRIARDFEVVAQSDRMLRGDLAALELKVGGLEENVAGLRRRLCWYEGAIALIGAGVAWLGAVAASVAPSWVHK